MLPLLRLCTYYFACACVCFVIWSLHDLLCLTIVLIVYVYVYHHRYIYSFPKYFYWVYEVGACAGGDWARLVPGAVSVCSRDVVTMSLTLRVKHFHLSVKCKGDKIAKVDFRGEYCTPCFLIASRGPWNNLKPRLSLHTKI